jgi:ActR/RegA family two-component response regulator
MKPVADPETILVVDDEDSVRRTFHDWLEGAQLGCRILAAADAEAALVHANSRRIDLAILDWNLGAGNDGLQLLEDLTVFNPDIVAIMVTGFAAQATPLAAMRMGVRDYLDKNQDLTRETFLRAVSRQLERIRPARRERRLNEGLAAFRTAVEQVLPLVQTASVLQDPLPRATAISHLFRLVIAATGAADGVLLVRSYDADRTPAEQMNAYSVDGQRLDVPLVPFARSLAGTATSIQEPCLLRRPEDAASLELQPFEKNRQCLLAAPLPVGPNMQAVLELFDKPNGFTETDRQVAGAAATFATEFLRHALTERQTQRVLFDAVAAALETSDALTGSLGPSTPTQVSDPAPTAMLDRLREGLRGGSDEVDATETVRLAEAIRALAVRHGPASLRHCVRLIESVRALLDEATGVGGQL